MALTKMSLRACCCVWSSEARRYLWLLALLAALSTEHLQYFHDLLTDTILTLSWSLFQAFKHLFIPRDKA